MFKDDKGLATTLKKVLITGMLMCSSIIPAHAVLIEVTTTEDHDGQDNTTCSLREAIHASLTKEAYGGCVAGERNVTDVIKLDTSVGDDGMGVTYQLERELKIDRQIDRFVRTIRIDGSDFFDPNTRDPITGLVNKRLLPKPTIVAAANHRVFNTAEDEIPLALNNLNIKGSKSSNISLGGALLVGGSVSLNNVTIKDGYAKRGGAIFLEGTNSSLSMNRTLIEGNQAEQGAVLGTNSFDDLNPERSTIEIKESSIANNTSSISGGSIIQVFGAASLSLSNTSMVGNDSQAGGALIDVSGVENSGSTIPKMTISFSTLAGNANGIRYSVLSGVIVRKSIVAFNTNYDCTFKAKDATGATSSINDVTRVQFSQNLLTGDPTRPTSNGCQLRQLTDMKPDTANSYVDSTAASQYFENASGGLVAMDYGLGLKGLLPIIITDDQHALLVNADGSSCSGSDMIGVLRNTAEAAQNQTCYKGALNRGRLIAVFDSVKTNFSYAGYIDRLQAQIDVEPSNDLTEQELENFNNITKQNKALLQAYKDAYDLAKNTNVVDFTGFRQVFVSVLENDVPYQKANGEVVAFPYLNGFDQNGDLNVLDAANYTMTTDISKSGNGPAEETSDPSKINNKAPVACRWDDKLQQIVIWRTDGSVTPTGTLDYCAYNITDINSSVTSLAYATARISNIAPIAEELTIDTSGNEPRVEIDLSKSISDDGDGTGRPLNSDGNPILSEFYTITVGTGDDRKTVSPYIEVVKAPELGRLVFSENNGESFDCPNPNSTQVDTPQCFGGTITYIRNNLVSEFDDSFTYRVYDGGTSLVRGPDGNQVIVGSLPSNEAKVLINANRRTGPATSIFSGGGSMSWFGVLGLFGMIGLRVLGSRRKRLS